MQLNFIKEFQPTLFQSLKTYNKEKFMSDLMAGIIVGIVALPLAIAFGISSGVTPEKGLITAIIAGFIISFLGGSSVQIGGPTGAFIVIVYGIVEKFGVQGLAIATVMAGVMLLAMGFMKLGSVIKFIPYPIIVGFTSGIALTIFSTQMKDFFGLQIASVPSNFIEKWGIYFQNFHTINLYPTIIGIVSVAIIFLSPKISKKIPGSLIAIVVMTIIVYFMRQYWGITEVETIGDRYEINASLPTVEPIGITVESMRLLFPSAFTIAMLGAIESLLSATVADGVTGDKHNSNMELIAQGAANLITPFFGGIPATGAIARTMTNINNGGRSPIAGIIHAIVLLLILLFLGNLTQHIPMACLAGVLVVVAYNMSEWRSFLSLSKQSRSTMAIMSITFLLTVIFDLTIAIEIGLLLSVFAFMKRINESATISREIEKLDISKDTELQSANLKDEILQIPKGIDVYEIEGPFFFGIANKFDDLMREIGDKPEVRIIRMRKVPFIDSTGLNNLENLCKSAKKEKIQIVLSGVNKDVHESLYRSHVPLLIGDDNICENIHIALERAKELMNQAISNYQ